MTHAANELSGTPSFERVLAEYLQAVESGRKPDRQELLRHFPHLATELQAYFDNADRFDALATPITVPKTADDFLATPFPSFADYEVLEEIASGGMGIVYKVRQRSAGRLVALKMIRPRLDMSEDDVRRFRQEAEAAAQLQHPHIVPIHDVGTVTGADGKARPYFTMDLIDGGSLAQHLKGRIEQGTLEKAALWAAEQRRMAEVVMTVARAVHFAHQHRILHRDLKPANVLLDRAGRPQLTDFGLAKRLEGGTGLTQTGAILGTAGYLAPEQASNPKGVTTAADVYGLGAILYECLTGRPPFQAELALDAILQLLDRDPQPPRQLNPRAHPDLETICLKCLKKEPHRRYGSAEAVAEELQNWLEGRPIHARPTGVFERAGKWARRRPAAALLIVASLLAMFGALAGGALFLQQRALLEREVETALEEAVSSRREAGEGRSMDLIHWTAALKAAKRAEGLTARGSVRDDLRERVREVLNRLEGEERTRTLILRLHEIRQRQSGLTGASFSSLETDPAYDQALREYGIDLASMESSEVVAAMQARGIPEVLGAALDDWARVRRALPKGEREKWTGLLRIAKEVDPDPVRNRLRDALLLMNTAPLREVVSRRDLDLPVPTWMLLGEILEDLNDPGREVEMMRQAHRQHPGDLWINHRLGRALQRVQPPRHEEAVRFLTAAVALSPQSPGLHLNLGNALVQSKQLEEAEAAFQEAVRLAPAYAMPHNSLGLVHRRRGDLERAIAAYRTALRLDQDNFQAHMNLAIAHQDRKEWNEALHHFRQGARLQPKDASVFYNFGRALQAAGNQEEALTAFQQSVRLAPKVDGGHFALALALADAQRWEEAAVSFRTAIQLNPKHARAYAGLGNSLRRLHQIDEAITAYQEAIRLDPKYGVAHTNLGIALAARGALEEAVAAHREAIRVQPDLGVAHHNLGLALTNKGDTVGAIAALREALRHPPTQGETYYLLGGHLLQRGDVEEALTNLKEAVRRKPNFADAHHRLGKARQQRGNLDDAEAAYRHALHLRPDFTAAHHDLGSLLQQQGRVREAVVSFLHYLQTTPEWWLLTAWPWR